MSYEWTVNSKKRPYLPFPVRRSHLCFASDDAFPLAAWDRRHGNENLRRSRRRLSQTLDFHPGRIGGRIEDRGFDVALERLGR